jgi:hypothetical protein
VAGDDMSSTPGTGGTPNGNNGSSSKNVVAAGFDKSFTKASGTYGQGGKFTKYSGAGGGSGGYNSDIVNVTPGTELTITVGKGGTYAARNSNYATSGNSGFIKIAYGEGVQEE